MKKDDISFSLGLCPSARGPARARSDLARIGPNPQKFGPLSPLLWGGIRQDKSRSAEQ